MSIIKTAKEKLEVNSRKFHHKWMADEILDSQRFKNKNMLPNPTQKNERNWWKNGVL